jgi:hypothetical protein
MAVLCLTRRSGGALADGVCWLARADPMRVRYRISASEMDKRRASSPCPYPHRLHSVGANTGPAARCSICAYTATDLDSLPCPFRATQKLPPYAPQRILRGMALLPNMAPPRLRGGAGRGSLRHGSLPGLHAFSLAARQAGLYCHSLFSTRVEIHPRRVRLTVRCTAHAQTCSTI